MREESDFIGTMEIPEDALYGIHAARARQNFPDTTPFPVEFYKAMGLVKLACYETCRLFRKAALEKYPGADLPIQLIPLDILDAMAESARQVAQGAFFEHFIVPSVSGGAGTSINMNVNEIIANASLVRMGHRPGEYALIDPVEHANVFQSTNDVVPTALKLAVMTLLTGVGQAINELREKVEIRENAHRHDLRIGYTQMQEAVPSSFGKLFSTYSDALSRDWWRVSKCFERIKTVNLGGGATGTGLAIPRFFIMEAASQLQKLTGLPVTRSENLADATANLDSFVEVHAILKSHAVNLEKMVSDLRLLASDIARQNFPGPLPVHTPDEDNGTTPPPLMTPESQISLPQQQAGSSIMPGKVNPVIPEFVISAAHRIYANDQLITSLSAQGCLELNAYIPVIGCSMIESLKLLIAMDQTLAKNLVTGMKINPGAGLLQLLHSPSVTTALVPFIGYHKAAELARLMKSGSLTIFGANEKLNLIDPALLADLMKPENLLKLGYSLSDIPVGKGL